ncbi:MAG TPA: hypothetical protein VK627_04550, partial [Edaphobacter sp.]|nr:hypothetical protein [Edaphobacter sp.]
LPRALSLDTLDRITAALKPLGFLYVTLDTQGYRSGSMNEVLPASACLSSRIEYGRPVTRENLSQVEQAEDALHILGFPRVRVRHHGNLARIEIAREDLPRALSLDTLDRITAALKPLGFLYVTLDTQGYRSGSMNEVLPASAITPATN